MESNTIFSVKMRHSENMLYFRSFVGQEYEDGKWKQNPNAGTTREACLTEDVCHRRV